jgi:hypothetical protein
MTIDGEGRSELLERDMTIAPPHPNVTSTPLMTTNSIGVFVPVEANGPAARNACRCGAAHEVVLDASAEDLGCRRLPGTGRHVPLRAQPPGRCCQLVSCCEGPTVADPSAGSVASVFGSVVRGEGRSAVKRLDLGDLDILATLRESERLIVGGPSSSPTSHHVVVQ